MSALKTRLRAATTLLAMCIRPDPRRAILAYAPIGPLAAGLSFASARVLIDAIPDDDTTRVVAAAGVFVAAWAASVVLGRLANDVRIRLCELVSWEKDRRLIEAASALPDIAELERPEYLDRAEIVRTRFGDIGNAPRMIGWLVDGSIGLVVSLALLVSVDTRLIFLLFAGVPWLLINERSWRRVERVREELAPSSRRSLHLFDLATTVGPAKEVRVSRLRDELMSRYRTEWRTVDRGMLRAETRAAVVRMIGTLFSAAAFALGILVLVDAVRNGEVSPGDVFVVLGMMTLVVGQLGNAAGGVLSMRRTMHITENLVWLANVASAAQRAEPATPSPIPRRVNRAIELERVSFTYTDSDHPALDDVSLALPAGTVVALVGENGAGKSTLVKLLFGLYRPTGGRITVDGIDLATMRAADWRQRTAACFQDFLQLDLTAGEGVGTGDLPRLDDDAALATAIARAGAGDVVALLPERLQTQIGPTFGGLELSGGQWQKLAIARAMMRDEPLLVALDEPTSALDPFAEFELFERYADVARGLAARNGAITVLVAHRFSTVRIADLIVVMDQGRVVETGSHSELMRNGALYAELYTLQARQYR